MIYTGIFKNRKFSVNLSQFRYLSYEEIKDNICAVYFILNHSACHKNQSLFYIGSALNLRRRLIRDHLNKLKNNDHDNRHLQFAWNLYGQESFSFGLLELCTIDQCRNREQNWLDFFNFNFSYQILFNICNKVENGPIKKGLEHPNFGKHLSYETIQKISQKAKQRMADPKNNPMYGKTHSLETRQKIGNSKKGRRNRFPVWNKGKNISEQTKAKISETLREKWNKKLIKINHSCKTYFLINPNGESVTIQNLSQFCRKNNFRRSSLYRVITGKRFHYKQWKLDKK